MPTLKGTEASLSYAQCFSYLVSSSISVSIFHYIAGHFLVCVCVFVYVCYLLFYATQECIYFISHKNKKGHGNRGGRCGELGAGLV